MWDDHDYSYQNGSSDYPDKAFSSKIFKHWWPNSGYAHTKDSEGIQNTYQYKDVAFFNTDPRYYKSRNAYLGDSQLDWLKNKLTQSSATFKFIVLGSPVLEEEKTSTNTETTFFGTGERAKLFEFIYANNIEGVVFLSGDYQRSHFGKYDPGCNSTYPLYEFMCSPLTSSPASGNSEHTGVFFEDNSNSYGKITVSGPIGNRSCLVESRDINGLVISGFTINENELKISGTPDIVPADHLRAHYQCNTEPYDISGNGFDASFVGSSFIGEENRFDEFGQANRVKTSNVFQPNTFVMPPESLDTAHDFTISLWIRPLYTGGGIFSAASATTGNEIFIQYTAAGEFSYSFRNSVISTTESYPTGEWYHLVATHRASDGLGRIYVNGNLAAKGTQIVGPTTIVSMLFGNDQDGAGGGNLDPNQQFYGAFDEIRLYDAILCEYQLMELYTEGIYLLEEVPVSPVCAAPTTGNFEVSGGINGSYQWYKDKETTSPISGETNAVLIKNITETTTFWASANSGWINSPRVPVTIQVAPPLYSESIGMTYPSSLTASYEFNDLTDQTSNFANLWKTGVSADVGIDGNPNSAFNFDNYPGIVVVPSQTLNEAERFSISLWVKTTDEEMAIFSGSNSNNNNELLLYIDEDGGLGLVMNGGIKNFQPSNVNDGNWHHLAVSCDAINALGNVYQDGHALRPKIASAFKAGALQIDQGAFILGNEQDIAGGGGLSADYQYEGMIDEFKIYRKQLNQEEVMALATQSDHYQSAIQVAGHAASVCTNDSLLITVFPYQREVAYSITNKNNLIVNGPPTILGDSLMLAVPVDAQDTFSLRATHLPTNCMVDFTTEVSAEIGSCFEIEAWLEGGFDVSTNELSDQLRAKGLLPLTDPYLNQATTSTRVLNLTDESSVVDWVQVELREISDPAQVEHTFLGLILKDGRITGPDRQGLVVPNTLAGDYYVFLNHRNHLPVMSDIPVTFGPSSTPVIDFKSNRGYSVLGANQKELAPGVYGLYSGDADKTDLGGYDINVTERLLWNLENGYFGSYKPSDFNLDGDVNSADRMLFSRNNGVFSNIPR